MNQKKRYLISFENGTIEPLSRPVSLADANEGMLERCEELNFAGELLTQSANTVVSKCILNSEGRAILADLRVAIVVSSSEINKVEIEDSQNYRHAGYTRDVKVLDSSEMIWGNFCGGVSNEDLVEQDLSVLDEIAEKYGNAILLVQRPDENEVHGTWMKYDAKSKSVVSTTTTFEAPEVFSKWENWSIEDSKRFFSKWEDLVNLHVDQVEKPNSLFAAYLSSGVEGFKKKVEGLRQSSAEKHVKQILFTLLFREENVLNLDDSVSKRETQIRDILENHIPSDKFKKDFLNMLHGSDISTKVSSNRPSFLNVLDPWYSPQDLLPFYSFNLNFESSQAQDELLYIQKNHLEYPETTRNKVLNLNSKIKQEVEDGHTGLAYVGLTRPFSFTLVRFQHLEKLNEVVGLASEFNEWCATLKFNSVKDTDGFDAIYKKSREIKVQQKLSQPISKEIENIRF